MRLDSSEVDLLQANVLADLAPTMFTKVVSSLGLLAASVAVLAVLLERTLPDAEVSLRLQDLPKRKRLFSWIPSYIRMPP